MSSKPIVIKNFAEFQSLQKKLESLYQEENPKEVHLHFPASMLSSVNSFFDQMIRQNGMRNTFFQFQISEDKKENTENQESSDVGA